MRSRLRKFIVLALILVGFFLLALLDRGLAYRSLYRSLGTTEDPLVFMAHSVRPGMTRAEVAKVIRGYSRLKTFPPDVLSPGGMEVYRFHLQFGPEWYLLGDYGSIFVTYDAQGRVISAETDLD